MADTITSSPDTVPGEYPGAVQVDFAELLSAFNFKFSAKGVKREGGPTSAEIEAGLGGPN